MGVAMAKTNLVDMADDGSALDAPPKRSKITIRPTEEQRTAIQRAVDLYDARYRDDDEPATEETQAATLAAICAQWRAWERSVMRADEEGDDEGE